MIELFFVTCLLAQPDRCTDRSLLFEERGGLFGCMLQGQSELARWIETHPSERVREWKCRYAGAGERRA
ncbi:hypothetical protein D3P06_16060 [Paracoccus aestuarii]|uniref:Uncharacterized protein n=1 Tax=Paracoccus aestuarii TaxID=453842 RepID=A0A418ZQN8_9RHOB|nr:hypothetical protein [Paracoccus aestuarii]RJK98529.1 hypothetical protein D3P06_16060 [Paracoccus aestuarii]WCQ98667.1 hypothetical protein JHW48_12355 [Paracoccus aestuarii]